MNTSSWHLFSSHTWKKRRRERERKKNDQKLVYLCDFIFIQFEFIKCDSFASHLSWWRRRRHPTRHTNSHKKKEREKKCYFLRQQERNDSTVMAVVAMKQNEQTGKMNWICFELRVLAIRHLLYAGWKKKYANSNDYYYFVLYLLIDSHFFSRSNISHFTFDSHNSKNHNSQSSHTCALLNGRRSIKIKIKNE